MKILANDGIDNAGKLLLEAAGFQVVTDKISQNELAQKISDFDVIIVRSATKVTGEIIENSNLKLIARAGVGLDNIDIKAAGEKNIPVVNTPNASSRSVGEMPNNGISSFKDLKKHYSEGFELTGKKLGIIGFGRIGQEVAKIAVGLGMEVLVYDYKQREFDLTIALARPYQNHNFQITLKGMGMDEILSNADFVSVHTPGSTEVIGKNEIEKMKKGAILINCARGGVVNEDAVFDAMNNRHLSAIGFDVFQEEPPINTTILGIQNASLTPHIGASTAEAQERVGLELAEKIISFFK
jgi:D-3-phosphoglycerate dehydrogenase